MIYTRIPHPLHLDFFAFMSVLHLLLLLFSPDGSIASKLKSLSRDKLDKGLVDPESDDDDDDDDMHIGCTPGNNKPELEEMYEKIE